MKSPSTPVIEAASSGDKRQSDYMRNDTCPSPLDENETGCYYATASVAEKPLQEPLRIKGGGPSFDEAAYLRGAQTQRTRTNSLINSVCCEVPQKVKFIKDMPRSPKFSKLPVTRERKAPLPAAGKAGIKSSRFR